MRGYAILSPTEGMQDIADKRRPIDKIKRYFEAGVKSCWLVQPIMETISVFARDMKPHVFSSGEVNDSVIGITLPLENIFSQSS